MGGDMSSLRCLAKGLTCNDQSYFPFLFLPLEVRLQIYDYIIEDLPARHSQLSPLHSQKSGTSPVYFVQTITTSPNLNTTSRGGPESQISLSGSGLPHFASHVRAHPTSTALRGHGCGHIPSTLLRACKQINTEARMIPFEQNEFVFVNWFSSGVYAARSFMRALRPWQRNVMRYARVEVLKRDLENGWVASMVDGKPGRGEWKDLCESWSGDEEAGMGKGGLWGLKLGIMGRVGDGKVQKFVNNGSAESVLEVREPEKRGLNLDSRTETGILNVNVPWITQGLAQMRNLKWLEIEIEDAEIHRDDQVRFCAQLGRKLNEYRASEQSNGESVVNVALVERSLPVTKIQDKAMEVGWVAASNGDSG